MVTSADFVTQQEFLFTKFFVQESEKSRQALIRGSLDFCDVLGVCRVGFGIPPQHVLRLQSVVEICQTLEKNGRLESPGSGMNRELVSNSQI